MNRFLAIFRRHPILAGTFTLALAATLFFAFRTLAFVIYWADPAHRDQALQGWMTPRYVAHSWDLPRELMQDVTGPLPDRRRPTLAAIAEGQGIALPVLINRLEAAIADHRGGERGRE